MKPVSRTQVESDEEWGMVLWLLEAAEYGLVKEWMYQPLKLEMYGGKRYDKKIVLKTKVKWEERELHPSEGYTPDFEILFTYLGMRLCENTFSKAFAYPFRENNCILIDTKGNYAKHGKAHFALIQKVVFFRHGIWVDKVIPFYTTAKSKKRKGLFVDTFVPESLRWMMGARSHELNVTGRHCADVKTFIAGTIQSNKNFCD